MQLGDQPVPARQQPRVLDRDGGVLREDLQQAQVVLVELRHTQLGQHDDADDLALAEQWHQQHRFLDDVGRSRDIERPRIAARVGNDERLLSRRDVAGHPLADLESQPLGRLARVLLDEAAERDRLQRLAVFADDVDDGVVVVDDLPGLDTDRGGHLGERSQWRQLRRDAVDGLELASPQGRPRLQAGRGDAIGQLTGIEPGHRAITEREVFADAAPEHQQAALRVGDVRQQHMPAIGLGPKEPSHARRPWRGRSDLRDELQDPFPVVEVQLRTPVRAGPGADGLEETGDAFVVVSGRRHGHLPAQGWRRVPRSCRVHPPCRVRGASRRSGTRPLRYR